MCLFPQTAQLNELGLLEFTTEGNMKIPCGKCNECVTKRAQEWALRARHEMSCHKENCAITLTYNPESLPSIRIVKTELQKFIKRLRKHLKKPIRYMVSHEYGSQTFRPHHHLLIFGWNPADQKYWKTTKKGNKIYRSPELEKLWTLGNSSINGTCNEKAAYYIAAYALKGKKHTLTDPHTGELISVSDSMDVSKRPAIGYNYFLKHHQQLINTNTILPRYYFKKLQTINPTLHTHYENERMLLFKTRSHYELNAKYIINEAQPHKSEFREDNEQIVQESAYHKRLLHQNSLTECQLIKAAKTKDKK